MSVELKPDIYAKVVSVFVRLSRSAGTLIEQTARTRAIHEAVATAPGIIQENWFQWFRDAGCALDIRINEFNASAGSVFHLADSGAVLVTWHDASGDFLIVDRDSQGFVRQTWQRDLASEESHHKGVRSSPKQLEQTLANENRTGPIRWVSVGTDQLQAEGLGGKRNLPDRHHTAGHYGASDHPHGSEAHATHPTPQTRLWRMLRPDFGDIVILIILGIVVGLLATAVPIAGQQLVRTVTFGTLYQPIIVLSLILLVFLGFMGALQMMNVFVVELIQQRLFARTVAEFAHRLPRMDYQALRNANGPELLNRFLEIATVQKVVAGLLVDGLTVVLTTVIGMTLLAFYHPFLLGYDIGLLALLFFVVLVLGRGGTQTAIRESIEKYRTTAWLEDVARCPLAFRLAGGPDFVLARADRLTTGYLDARRQHFRVLVRQLVCLFAIQALASTTLLGLGGYLVMHEQLTLGQLVAAELIVTMIVGSFAKLAKHIEGFFDLMAAVDKLGHILDLPLEHSGLSLRIQPDSPLVELKDTKIVRVSSAESAPATPVRETVQLRVLPGRHVSLLASDEVCKNRLADMLFGLETTTTDTALIFGCHIRELASDILRRHVALIRSTEILPGSVEENIHLGRHDVDGAQIREALRTACLYHEVAALPDGQSTQLTCSGFPLSDSQQMRLMIARAVAGHPKLLVIDGLLDRLPDNLIEPVLTNLQASDSSWTLLLMTGRRDIARRFADQFELVGST